MHEGWKKLNQIPLAFKWNDKSFAVKFSCVKSGWNELQANVLILISAERKDKDYYSVKRTPLNKQA